MSLKNRLRRLETLAGPQRDDRADDPATRAVLALFTDEELSVIEERMLELRAADEPDEAIFDSEAWRSAERQAVERIDAWAAVLGGEQDRPGLDLDRLRSALHGRPLSLELAVSDQEVNAACSALFNGYEWRRAVSAPRIAS